MCSSDLIYAPIHYLRILSEFGACLVGVGVVGILKNIGRDNLNEAARKKRSVVAMDGGIYEHYPLF